MVELVRHPLIDEILDARREHARGHDAAFEGYRNHAHRILNFVRAISSLSPEDEEKIAIAAAFHDLCAFDGLDYLEPSIEAAAGYLRETGREAWDREVALTIAFHHRVRPYRGEPPSSSSRSAAPTGTTSRWASSGPASRATCAKAATPSSRSATSSRRRSPRWRSAGCRATRCARSALPWRRGAARTGR